VAVAAGELLPVVCVVPPLAAAAVAAAGVAEDNDVPVEVASVDAVVTADDDTSSDPETVLASAVVTAESTMECLMAGSGLCWPPLATLRLDRLETPAVDRDVVRLADVAVAVTAGEVTACVDG
jgi:hypothetical protein